MFILRQRPDSDGPHDVVDLYGVQVEQSNPPVIRAGADTRNPSTRTFVDDIKSGADLATWEVCLIGLHSFRDMGDAREPAAAPSCSIKTASVEGDEPSIRLLIQLQPGSSSRRFIEFNNPLSKREQARRRMAEADIDVLVQLEGPNGVTVVSYDGVHYISTRGYDRALVWAQPRHSPRRGRVKTVVGPIEAPASSLGGEGLDELALLAIIRANVRLD